MDEKQHAREHGVRRPVPVERQDTGGIGTEKVQTPDDQEDPVQMETGAGDARVPRGHGAPYLPQAPVNVNGGGGGGGSVRRL